MKRLFACLLWLITFTLSANHAVSDNGRYSGALLDSYLGDSTHAARNILSLLNYSSDTLNRGAIIQRYQLALTLEPYAADSPLVLFQLHSRLAGVLREAGAGEQAVQHLHIARQYLIKASEPHGAGMYNLLGNIAAIYMTAEENDSALFYYQLAVVVGKQSGENLWEASGHNNLGFFLARLGLHDSAYSEFETALSILRPFQHEGYMLLGSIRDNIAGLDIMSGNFERGAKYYGLNFLLYDSAGIRDKAAQAKYGYAKLLIAEKKFKEAEKILQQADAYVAQYLHKIRTDYRLALAEVWLKYYEATGNMKAALAKQKWIAATRDSLNAATRAGFSEMMQALIKSEGQKFSKDLELRHLELEKARIEARRNLFWAFSLFIIGLLIIALMVAYFRSKTRIQKKELELERVNRELSERNLQLKQLEKEKLEQELVQKQGDVSDLATYLSRLKDMNDNMYEKLGEMKSKSTSQQREVINQLMSELGAQLNAQEKQQLIQENISQVNKEFYNKLAGPFPELTKSEMELCGFIRLNMTNKEIGALKNISPESVKMARNRLRKKLKLEPAADLYKFLIGI